jgi:peptide chain release factor subunit 1
MLTVLDEYDRCCTAVVDRESAHIWELYLGNVRDAGKLRYEALRNPSYAGWNGLDEHHVRNRAEELEKRHFRRVASELERVFGTGRFDVLTVAGHEHEIPRFIEMLSNPLRGRLIGTFAIDPNTATTRTIRERAEEILESYEREQERLWVAEVLESAAAGGPAAVGLDSCLWAGSVAAIERLLVNEGATAPGVVCDQSHWLARSGETCPLCGAATRATPDVIDELAEAVVAESGSIRHVGDGARLGKRVAAASLRFPLPPEPVSSRRGAAG